MGVSVIFGGQWGSEGKGKTTYFFTKKLNASAVVRVGGPNSGHTIVTDGGEKMIFRILPVVSVLEGVACVLPSGSYIDINTLKKEVQASKIHKGLLKINPNAVVMRKSDSLNEENISLNKRIGSTESGTGSAVISRIKRNSDVLLAKNCRELQPYLCDTTDYLRNELNKSHEIIIEGTQGFGLSLLHAKEYPFTTSRDTSAAAFVSEAGLSPFDVKNIIMTLRTFPIRVAGNSGPLPQEITWKNVSEIARSNSLLLERTTVTKKIRRVAKFDIEVVHRSITANCPNIIVLNHCDYFDYSINNQAFLSAYAENGVKQIEAQIGRVNYVGTGDRTIFMR